MFVPLRGEAFRVVTETATSAAGFKLLLGEVSDLRPALRAHDQERFSLLFTAGKHSKGALPSGILTLHHRAIGRFELFVSPVERPGARLYQAVINRSRL